MEILLMIGLSFAWGFFLGYHWSHEKPRTYKIDVVAGKLVTRELR